MKFYTSFRKLNIKYKHCIYKFEKKKRKIFGEMLLPAISSKRHRISFIVYRSSYMRMRKTNLQT